jgi:hypothetical protein
MAEKTRVMLTPLYRIRVKPDDMIHKVRVKPYNYRRTHIKVGANL